MRTDALSLDEVSPPIASIIDGGGIFRRVLISIDSLETARNALLLGLHISEATGAPLRLVHVRVWDPYSIPGGRFYTETSDEAWGAIEQALAWIWQSGADASGTVIDTERSRVGEVMLREARQFAADVILLTIFPRRRLSLGCFDRVSRQLIKRSEIPVLLVHAARS